MHKNPTHSNKLEDIRQTGDLSLHHSLPLNEILPVVLYKVLCLVLCTDFCVQRRKNFLKEIG